MLNLLLKYFTLLIVTFSSLQNEYLEKELNKKERELELHKTQFQVKCKWSHAFNQRLSWTFMCCISTMSCTFVCLMMVQCFRIFTMGIFLSDWNTSGATYSLILLPPVYYFIVDELSKVKRDLEATLKDVLQAMKIHQETTPSDDSINIPSVERLAYVSISQAPNLMLNFGHMDF